MPWLWPAAAVATVRPAFGHIIMRIITAPISAIRTATKSVFATTMRQRCRMNITLLAQFRIGDPNNGRIAIISDINEMILQEFKNKTIDLA